MPSGYGRAFPALGGCLAFLLWSHPGLSQVSEKVAPPIVLESQPVPNGGETADKSGGENSGKQEDSASEKLSTALNKIESTIQELIAQERETQRQSPEDKEVRDLKAQEGMVYWAKAMFWATLTAVGLTLVGIWLIKRTLDETRRAANAAQSTIDFMRKAERPFLLATAIKPDGFGKAFSPIQQHGSAAGRQGVTFSAAISNVGTRPGIIVDVGFDYCFQPPPQDQPIGDIKSIKIGKRVISPESELTDIMGAFVLQGEFIHKLSEYQEHLCVHGFIRYADMNGTTWRSGFSFGYCLPSEGMPEGFFVPSSPMAYWYDIEEKPEC